MKPTFLIFSVSLFLCCSYGAAQDNETAFTDGVMAVGYETGAGVQQTDGTNKAEAYDVALKLQDNSLVGKKIVGLRIPIINADGLSNLSGWLSSELKLEEIDETTVNVPNITSKSVAASTGWTEVVFDQPYEITSSGVYAGYSFEVTKTNNQNLKPVSTTSEINKNGYFLRTSRTRKYQSWYNPYANDEQKGSLRLQVMVAGMDGDAVAIELYPLVNVQSDAEANIPATLYCHGFNGISSITYEYVSGSYSGEGSIELDTPVEACYNRFVNIDLPIKPISELGEHQLTVTITQVNGNPNLDSQPSADCSLYVFDFVPKHIPLVEEYSGTWCGNCPRGIASMELMKERHGEDFICLTYHNSDPMTTDITYPSVVRGFPDCWIDRSKNTDPFFGDRNDGLFHFEEEWNVFNLKPATVALEVQNEWADEDETLLKTKVKLRSQKEYFEGELSLAFMLVADDLYGDKSWNQTNYYSGDDTCPELAEMAAQPSKIQGWHFNDVVILGENVDGAKYNLPASIKPLDEYEVENIFNISDAVNTDGDWLVQNKNKLKVVVAAIDPATGTVDNCCQSEYMTTSGIADIHDDSAQLIDVKYYDLSGIQVSSPDKGIFFKRVSYSDGSVITHKIIRER